MTKKSPYKERINTFSCGTLTYRHPTDVWEDTEILLVKQFEHKDNWGIPKGHTHKDESFETCAIRETREEAGVDVIIERKLITVNAANKNENKTVVTFLAKQACSREPTHIHPESEVADARWFKINELPRIILYQEAIIFDGLKTVRNNFENNNE